MSEKLKKYLGVAYVILMIGGFFYIRSVLMQAPVDVITKDTPKTVKEVKLVHVTLNVENGKATTTGKYEFRNVDTVSDLLRKARDTDQVYYELISYTDKVVILVDGKTTPANQSWRVFYNDKDVTDNFGDENLVDGGIYTLKLVTHT